MLTAHPGALHTPRTQLANATRPSACATPPTTTECTWPRTRTRLPSCSAQARRVATITATSPLDCGDPESTIAASPSSSRRGCRSYTRPHFSVAANSGMTLTPGRNRPPPRGSRLKLSPRRVSTCMRRTTKAARPAVLARDCRAMSPAPAALYRLASSRHDNQCPGDPGRQRRTPPSHRMPLAGRALAELKSRRFSQQLADRRPAHEAVPETRCEGQVRSQPRATRRAHGGARAPAPVQAGVVRANVRGGRSGPSQPSCHVWHEVNEELELDDTEWTLRSTS